MTAKVKSAENESATVKQIALFFSIFMLAVSFIAAVYEGVGAGMFTDWARLLTSPAQLTIDSFSVGGLAAAFFNSGLCGLVFTLMMFGLKANCTTGVLAGYMLLMSHSFFGLNFLNIWPMVLGVAVFYAIKKDKLRNHLDIAMFATNFCPFVSEFLFRYELFGKVKVPVGEAQLQIIGIPAAIIYGIVIGLIFPTVLPVVKRTNKGLSLYNAGLAAGFIGILMYAFFFKTLGVTAPSTFTRENPIYIAHGNSYQLFISIVLAVLFVLCIIIGASKNKGFSGYGKLLKDSGFKADFIKSYGAGCTWLNFGFYGFLLLIYFNIVILLFPQGAGFTGITVGFLLAALTFTASGQHPGNVWPIMIGYVVVSAVIIAITTGLGRDIPWVLSTQGYMCTLALGTGLAPFAGFYGKKAGILTGAICCIMSCVVSSFHGGFILYSSGFASGLAAIICFSLFDNYIKSKKAEE